MKPHHDRASKSPDRADLRSTGGMGKMKCTPTRASKTSYNCMYRIRGIGIDKRTKDHYFGGIYVWARRCGCLDMVVAQGNYRTSSTPIWVCDSFSYTSANLALTGDLHVPSWWGYNYIASSRLSGRGSPGGQFASPFVKAIITSPLRGLVGRSAFEAFYHSGL